MSTIYAAVDVETTGFDPHTEDIIEVAVVVFQDNVILDEYTTLINPQREIPAEITALTGIGNSDVANAPTMFKVRSKIQNLVGDHLVVGHNVGFDMGFLNAARIGVGNRRIDTITLASILFPEAGRYGLGSLARFLNLPGGDSQQTHRAYDDTMQTVELFLAARERALTLDIWQLEEIISAGNNVGWSEALFFEEALALKAREAFESDGRSAQRPARLFNPPKLDGEPLVPVEKNILLDKEAVIGMIKPGGNFARTFPGFEYRAQQAEMIERVIEAYNEGDHILVEAGTGTGKSVAYLLPSAFWAQQNGRRVVISTNTINLQDQLVNKDIPALQKTLPFKLQTAVRKGRRNYICNRLFKQMRHKGPSDHDEMTLFARILLWLPTTATGDVAEIPLRTPRERQAWARLNSENPACTGESCAAARCPLHITKRRAEQAHILIVNHALLLSDVANNNHILPPFADLIIDEAHHLESAVTDGLSFRADKRSLDAALDDVRKPRGGLIGDAQKRMLELPPNFVAEADTLISYMRGEADGAGFALDDFFATLSYFLQDHLSARSQYAQQVRLTTAVRAQPGYDEVELAWENLHKPLKIIAKGFNKLADILERAAESYDIEDGDALRLTLVSDGRSLKETCENIEAIISSASEAMITWVEFYNEKLSLHAAPLHIGPLVEEHIFKAKETVVLTSATMQTASPTRRTANFDYIRDRLHAQDTNQFAVGSPFDYKNNALLYLVTDIPEPNQPGYQRYIEDAVVEVATTLGGRTLVLFTSYGQLKQTATAVQGRLAAQNIDVLAQTSGSSRQQLLAQFKEENGRTVLFGTRSFWEGVDVPGDALQAVLITKLLFDVPSDPIVAARSETFENAFFEYSVPEAALRFRQGFGRLIRRKSDEGMVVILDKRVISKRYGHMFLDALPECTVIRQRHGRLAELTARWMNRERKSS